MKKSAVKKNYLYNVLYQLLAICLPLITTPYISRVLGSDGVGTYSYTLSIVTYFILFGTLGTNTYAQREIAYYQDDVEKRSKVFKEIFILRLITFGISCLIFILSLCIFEDNKLYYRILIIELVANMIDITWLFQGMEDFGRIVLKNVIVKIVSIISIFLFVKSPDDLWIYLLVYSLSNFLGFASLWIDVKKYVVKSSSKDKLNIKRHLGGILLLFIPHVASTIYNVLDKTMLGMMASDISSVGYYEQAEKVTRLSLTVITALGTVMLPRIANLNANGNKKQLKDNIYKSFNVTFLLSFPICFGLIGISDNLVPWFFGPGYEEVNLLIKICSPIVIIVGLANVMGAQYLLAIKQQNKYTVAIIASAIVNFLGNLLLIPKIAEVGVSIMSVIAELVGVIIEYIYIRKEFDLKKILIMMKNYLCAGVVMLFLILYISQFLSTSIFNTFLLIFIGVLFYFFILIFIKDKLITNLIKNILEKVKKNEYR